MSVHLALELKTVQNLSVVLCRMAKIVRPEKERDVIVKMAGKVSIAMYANETMSAGRSFQKSRRMMRYAIKMDSWCMRTGKCATLRT